MIKRLFEKLKALRLYFVTLLFNFKRKDMNKQEKCKCKEPILQPQTKQCGRCKLYIDRVRHILLTNPNKDQW